MKHLLPIISILFFSCQKECLPPPCEPKYFADVRLKEKQGVEYTLLIGNAPFDSWKGDTTSQVRSFDVTDYHTGEPMVFRVRAYLPGLFAFSDVYMDSVRTYAPELYQLPAQNGSGSLWVHREGGVNKITVRNALNCASQARLIYNGKDTLLNLAPKQAGTEGGTDYVFFTEDEVFDISFQLLTPCEYWLKHDVIRVSSSKIVPFEFDMEIGVREEECDNNVKY